MRRPIFHALLLGAGLSPFFRIDRMCQVGEALSSPGLAGFAFPSMEFVVDQTQDVPSLEDPIRPWCAMACTSVVGFPSGRSCG